MQNEQENQIEVDAQLNSAARTVIGWAARSGIVRFQPDDSPDEQEAAKQLMEASKEGIVGVIEERPERSYLVFLQDSVVDL